MTGCCLFDSLRLTCPDVANVANLCGECSSAYGTFECTILVIVCYSRRWSGFEKVPPSVKILSSLVLKGKDTRLDKMSPIWTLSCALFPALRIHITTLHVPLQHVLVSKKLAPSLTFAMPELGVEDPLRQSFVGHSGNVAAPAQLTSHKIGLNSANFGTA